MPGTDGITASRRIRSEEAAAAVAPVPIVALTANVHDDDRQRCRDAGMDAFLTKPLDQERLVETIGSLCTARGVLAA